MDHATRITLAARYALVVLTAAVLGLSAATQATAAQASPAAASSHQVSGTAGPRSHTAVISVPAGKSSATLTMGGTTVTVVRSVRSAVVLTCTVAPGKPYHGTAGVSSTVWAYCNSNAATLSYGTALYYNGSNVSENNATIHNCTNCYVTVTAPYESGQWQAGAILGYSDSSGDGQFTDEAYSAKVTL